MTDCVVEVFVPGHITGLFSPHQTKDAAQTGSWGVGLTLTDGVTVCIELSTDPVTTINQGVTEVESVTRVLRSMGVRAEVHATTDLPIGAGFGVSGAMALGTAFAANAVTNIEHTENDLVRIAHVAEVHSGSGLGDVVAQARGGVPIRLEPGAPPHGQLDGIPERIPIEYVCFGELSTEAILSGDTETVSVAGMRGLEKVCESPTMETFMAASREFAGDAGLLSDDVAMAINNVEDTGGKASMAMLGCTVFALDTGLTDAGYAPQRCHINNTGAVLQ